MTHKIYSFTTTIPFKTLDNPDFSLPSHSDLTHKQTTKTKHIFYSKSIDTILHTSNNLSDFKQTPIKTTYIK